MITLKDTNTELPKYNRFAGMDKGNTQDQIQLISLGYRFQTSRFVYQVIETVGLRCQDTTD